MTQENRGRSVVHAGAGAVNRELSARIASGEVGPAAGDDRQWMRDREAACLKHPVWYSALSLDGDSTYLIIIPDGTSDTGSRILAIGRSIDEAWRKAAQA